MKNLFNEDHEIDVKAKKFIQLSKYQKFRRLNNFRLGTKEQRCKTCQYCIVNSWGVKNFYKCQKMGGVDKASPASDTKIKMVCDLWRKG